MNLESIHANRSLTFRSLPQFQFHLADIQHGKSAGSLITEHSEAVSDEHRGGQPCNSGSEVRRVWWAETDKRHVFLCPFSSMRTGFVRARLKRLCGQGMVFGLNLHLYPTARLQIKDSVLVSDPLTGSFHPSSQNALSHREKRRRPAQSLTPTPLG